jgi:hypothetical protein
VGGYWKWKGSEMWIMVEPIAKIPFGIRQSPTWCYGCNRCADHALSESKSESPSLISAAVV